MLSMTGGRTVVRSYLGGPATGMNAMSFARQQKRFFSEFQIGMFSRHPRTISDKLSAEEAVDSMFEVLVKSGFSSFHQGRLKVVTLPEFAFNRHLETVTVGSNEELRKETQERYNAGSPLSWDLFQALIQRTRWHMSRLDPGLVVVYGGNGVSTGEVMPDGRIRGANLGVIFESGTAGDFVLYNKVHHDPLDNWDLEKYSLVPADGEIGPRSLEIADPTGGRSRIISFFTCADMTKGPFPRDMARSALVLCSSYGTPKGWQLKWVEDKNISEYAVVAVNDSSLEDMNGGAGPTGVFQFGQRPKHPWLTSFHSVAGWAGFADWALTAYQVLFGISPTELTAKELGFNKIETSAQTTDGLFFVTTAVRKFGPEE